jgi:hypothetical protein
VEKIMQESSQIKPVYDFSGNALPDNMDFFKTPENIGITLLGFSDLTVNEQPLSYSQQIRNYTIAVLVGIIISTIIFSCVSLRSPFWIAVWSLVPTVAVIFFTYFDPENTEYTERIFFFFLN